MQYSYPIRPGPGLAAHHARPLRRAALPLAAPERAMNWSPRILIAERDATVRTLLIALVTTQYPTARIAAVPDGLAALATYAAYGADLVITAQRLPGMRGLDLVRALRAEQAALPILLLSADAGLEADALDAGASAFLPKLAPFAALRQALTTLLPPHVARTV